MKDKMKRALIVLGSVVLLLILSLGLIQVLFPFLIALILAFIINPVVNYLTLKFKISRGLSVAITMLTLSGGLVVAIIFSFFEMIAGIKYLTKKIPETIDSISETISAFTQDKVIPILDEISKIYDGLSESDRQSVLQQLDNVKDDWLSKIGTFTETLLTDLLSLLQSLPSFATILLFVLLGTFFISKDWYSLKGKLISNIPDKMKMRGMELQKGLHGAFIGFIKAQIIVLVITIVITIIGMFILQIKHAFLVGLLIGAIDIIPYAGTGLVLIPWSIYSFIIGDTWMGIGLAATYLTIVVVRQIVEPKVLSSNMGLNTFATIISMYVGLVLFGIFGLIIGPALLVLITTCIRIHVFHDIWAYIQKGQIEWNRNEKDTK